MQKLIRLTTVTSLFMCVSTSNFASVNQTEVQNFSQTAQPATSAQSAAAQPPVEAPAPVSPPQQAAPALATPTQQAAATPATPPQQAAATPASPPQQAASTPASPPQPAASAQQLPQVITTSPSVNTATPQSNQAEQAAPAEEANTELALLSQRFDHFFNEYSQLQEQAKQKLDKLETENAELKNELHVLDKQVTRLLEWQNSDVSGLSRQDSIWLGVGFSVILIWLLVLTLRRQDRPVVAQKTPIDPLISKHDEADIEDEYDYLGSEEGIAAKIDLARAYHDMGDVELARQVLQDVLHAGNAEQKQAAADLLNQIEQAAVH